MVPRHYTVDPMLFPSGNPFICHEEVLYLQPLIPPKRFDISPPDWGMLRRSRCVLIFLSLNNIKLSASSFYFFPLEMELFPSVFEPLPFSLCTESMSYVSPFRKEFKVKSERI